VPGGPPFAESRDDQNQLAPGDVEHEAAAQHDPVRTTVRVGLAGQGATPFAPLPNLPHSDPNPGDFLVNSGKPSLGTRVPKTSCT
jgi:hypothetical protein